MSVSHPDKIGYVHRANDRTHLYFLSNLSDEELDASVKFKSREEPARVWSVNSARPVPFASRNGEICLHMHAHESFAVVFSNDLEGAPLCSKPPVYQHQKILTDWTLRVEDQEFAQRQPSVWNGIPGFEHYSGMGVYECTFEMDEAVENATLCLSELHCAARVYLNGELVGDIWTHPLELACTKQLRSGKNHLRIEVYSTLINEMMTDGSYEACPDVLDGWPYYGSVINAHRKARLNCMREYLEQPAPLSSGLQGDVTLKW